MRATFTDIVIAFCQACGVSQRDLTSARREDRTVRIRWALWTELYKHGYSYEQIGKRTNRDHTTVLHGIRKHAVAVYPRDFINAVERAKALIPEIASQRAAGVVFDLVAARQQEALKNRADDELCAHAYARSVRAEGLKATKKLAAALKSEAGPA
jgi:hypothetical protein